MIKFIDDFKIVDNLVENKKLDYGAMEVETEISHKTPKNLPPDQRQIEVTCTFKAKAVYPNDLNFPWHETVYSLSRALTDYLFSDIKQVLRHAEFFIISAQDHLELNYQREQVETVIEAIRTLIAQMELRK
jgi:hypothetical protein